MNKFYLKIRKHLGKALLIVIMFIGIASTSDRPARVASYLEGRVIGEGLWDGNVGLRDVEISIDNSVLGTTDIFGYFSVRRNLLEGTTETNTVVFYKEGYNVLESLETFVAGRIVVIPNDILMTECNSTK